MKSGLQKRKFNYLNISIILLIFAVLTDRATCTNGRVDVEPSSLELLEGQKSSFVCRYPESLTYCRIEIPGENILNLSPDWERRGFKYFGDGLTKGQCGVTIEQVSSRNDGKVKCFLGTKGEELEGSIMLSIAKPPSSPVIEVLSERRGDAFEVDTELRARCTARDGRPPAQLAWFLDTERITSGIINEEPIPSVDERNISVFTATQHIKRYLTADDDGKFLICKSSHLTDRGEHGEAKIQLYVQYRPQPLPDIKVYGLILQSSAMITVKIHANPRPSVEWTVDGITIKQGFQIDRYESYEPLDLGNGDYNISLSVAGLTLEDTTKEYHLKAFNKLGATDYSVRISSSNTPAPAGLDIGTIIGIVVGIAILLIIVLLIIFARATGRWCFGGKTQKPPTSETLEDGHSGANRALLSNQNSITNANSNIINDNLVPNTSTTSPTQHINNNNIMNAKTNNNSNVNNNSNNNTNNYDNVIKQMISTTIGNRLSTRRPSSTIDTNSLNNDNKQNDSYLIVNSNNDINNETITNNHHNNNNNNSFELNDYQLGIPESRYSKWVPKDQRELLKKQAELLVNRGSKSTDIY